eukprot:TRINITY_DN112452_c0_g1_i1.p1 TRINITY_DN112452_c0_g1~~TRINITY_DN112452_c0_g1_i1.p1  ORF type:complete len:261 (-),score=61.32 TRINITY_DN112452_c0_g1_i1:26-808(-)
MRPMPRCVRNRVVACALLALAADGESSSSGSTGLKDITEDVDMADTCEGCLAKGGGWCMPEQRCVEDDTQYCDSESLIGLAGFSSDCRDDVEALKPKGRRWLDKGCLVSYTFENGSCCMGQGIVHRAYHYLEEYTVFLPNSSREEVKTQRWMRRKPAKKKDENSEYHNMEFRYFRASELTVVSGIRPSDLVQAHFMVKSKDAEAQIKSKRTEAAVVVNVTVDSIAVNYTADHVVSILPRDYVVDLTNMSRPPERATHDEL